MMRQGKITTILFSLIAALLFVAAPPAYAKTVPHKKTAQAKKPSVPSLNIQGFRVGMTVKTVRQLLQKKKVTGYETAFSDLFVYDPSPGTEMKLLFTCGPKGNVLGKVELSTAFTVDETEAALAKFKEKLVSKYGMPSISDSQWDRLDFCWGQCGQDETGTKLTARTTAPQGGRRALVLTLDNDSLAETCAKLRPKKINGFLYQWIDDVKKFKPGMSFRDASALYQKRYHDTMAVEEERDEASTQYAVTDYVVKGYDFFTALDYESLTFEGQGPGAIILKFTGDQAGKGSLNRRLYYTSFSTTTFKNVALGPDLPKKLALFIRAYGKPSDLSETPGKILASWEDGPVSRKLEIDDTGFIAFEQSDTTLKDAYREAATENLRKYWKGRLDRNLF